MKTQGEQHLNMETTIYKWRETWNTAFIALEGTPLPIKICFKLQSSFCKWRLWAGPHTGMVWPVGRPFSSNSDVKQDTSPLHTCFIIIEMISFYHSLFYYILSYSTTLHLLRYLEQYRNETTKFNNHLMHTFYDPSTLLDDEDTEMGLV